MSCLPDAPYCSCFCPVGSEGEEEVYVSSATVCVASPSVAREWTLGDQPSDRSTTGGGLDFLRLAQNNFAAPSQRGWISSAHTGSVRLSHRRWTRAAKHSHEAATRLCFSRACFHRASHVFSSPCGIREALEVTSCANGVLGSGERDAKHR